MILLIAWHLMRLICDMLKQLKLTNKIKCCPLDQLLWQRCVNFTEMFNSPSTTPHAISDIVIYVLTWGYTKYKRINFIPVCFNRWLYNVSCCCMGCRYYHKHLNNNYYTYGTCIHYSILQSIFSLCTNPILISVHNCWSILLTFVIL